MTNEGDTKAADGGASLAPGGGVGSSQTGGNYRLADVEQQVSLFVAEYSYILELQSVIDRVIGRLEYHKRGASAQGPLDQAGLLGVIEQAVQDQLLAEFRELEHGAEGRPETSDRDSFLISGIGVRPNHARRVGVAFNRLALITRRAFFGLVVRGEKIEDLVGEGNEWATPEELRLDVVLALDTLMGRNTPVGGEGEQ